MADLTYLTTFFADWNAAGITGDTWDPGFGNDAFRPWCDVQFTPVLIGQDSQEISITEQTPKLTLLLLPVPARLESGVLKAVRMPAPSQETPTAGEWEEQDESIGVPLTAETPALELPPGVHLIYRVKFGPMKIQGGSYQFDDFDFAAPTTSTRVHLTTVDRINLLPSDNNQLTLRMIPDDVTLVAPNKIQFWSNGIALGAALTIAVSGGGGGGPAAWGDITDKPTVIAAGETQDAARTAIAAIGATELTNAIAASAGGLQPSDPDLTAIAALPSTANRLPYSTGPSAWSLTEFSPFGRSVAALADGPALRTLAGLVIGVNVQQYSPVLAGFASVASTGSRIFYTTDGGTTWSASTSTSFGRQLGAVADAPAARTLIGALAASAVGAANGAAPLDGNSLIPPIYLPSYVDDVVEAATMAGFPAVGETGKIYTALNAGTSADPSKIYRWSGSAYVEISPSPGSTDAVPEGATNLYFTAARADARIAAARGVTIQAQSSILAAIAALTLVNDNVLQVKGGAVTQRTPAQLKTDLGLTKADVGLGSADNTADSAKVVASAAKLTTARNINGVSFDGTANIVLAPALTTVTNQPAPSVAAAPNMVLNDTGLAQAVTGVTVTGAAGDGYRLLMRFRDDGTSRALALGAAFRPLGVTVPAATTAGKLLTLGAIYNAVDSVWDVVAVSVQG